MTKPRSPLPKESPKRRAAREAAGRGAFSTFVAKPKAIRKVNPERKAKRRIGYRAGMAAYNKSETKKIVAKRAGGRCEFVLRVTHYDGALVEHFRCTALSGLQDHHKTYARFGKGYERPEDILRVCTAHHAFLESQHPTRNRNYR